MSLEILWFAIVAVFWTGFLILEGFDFGVGMLHRFIGRSDDERRLAINAIGPTWDANEVWLIVGAAAIFAAFPDWYATWLSAGYLAILLLLFALIIRGVSFEWRCKSTAPGWRSTFSWMITIGSAAVPLILGIALGDLLAGLPIDQDLEFTGGPADLLTGYGIWLGCTLLVLCLVQGATFLSLKTDGAVRQRARVIASRLSWIATGGVIVFAIWTEKLGGASLAQILALAIPVVFSVLAVASLRTAHEGRSFAASSVAIGGTVVALFVNLYPNVMVSSTDVANNLTIEGVASSSYALQVMTVVALVMTPIVLAYQGWSFWVFRSRLRLGPVDSPASERSALTSMRRGMPASRRRR